MKQLTVHKGRTNVVQVSVGFDVSQDVITSEIREEQDSESTLIAAWQIVFLTDGTDGELILTLDNAITSAIEKSKGYMDMKRVTAGEPTNVFDEPIEVLFKTVVTA